MAADELAREIAMEHGVGAIAERYAASASASAATAAAAECARALRALLE